MVLSILFESLYLIHTATLQGRHYYDSKFIVVEEVKHREVK